MNPEQETKVKIFEMDFNKRFVVSIANVQWDSVTPMHINASTIAHLKTWIKDTFGDQNICENIEILNLITLNLPLGEMQIFLTRNPELLVEFSIVDKTALWHILIPTVPLNELIKWTRQYICPSLSSCGFPLYYGNEPDMLIYSHTVEICGRQVDLYEPNPIVFQSLPIPTTAALFAKFIVQPREMVLNMLRMTLELSDNNIITLMARLMGKRYNLIVVFRDGLHVQTHYGIGTIFSLLIYIAGKKSYVSEITPSDSMRNLW